MFYAAFLYTRNYVIDLGGTQNKNIIGTKKNQLYVFERYRIRRKQMGGGKGGVITYHSFIKIYMYIPAPVEVQQASKMLTTIHKR